MASGERLLASPAFVVFLIGGALLGPPLALSAQVPIVPVQPGEEVRLRLPGRRSPGQWPLWIPTVSSSCFESAASGCSVTVMRQERVTPHSRRVAPRPFRLVPATAIARIQIYSPEEWSRLGL